MISHSTGNTLSAPLAARRPRPSPVVQGSLPLKAIASEAELAGLSGALGAATVPGMSTDERRLLAGSPVPSSTLVATTQREMSREATSYAEHQASHVALP